VWEGLVRGVTQAANDDDRATHDAANGGATDRARPAGAAPTSRQRPASGDHGSAGRAGPHDDTDDDAAYDHGADGHGGVRDHPKRPDHEHQARTCHA
jgi:hypothetical protein